MCLLNYLYPMFFGRSLSGRKVVDPTASASPAIMPATYEPPSPRTIPRRVPASAPDAGKKTIDRSRTRSSPSLASNAAASSSASSSSTSLPRSILPAARSGTFGPVDTHRRRAEQSEAAMSSAEQSSRPRTLSESSSGHSHGRQSVKTRPPTPG